VVQKISPHTFSESHPATGIKERDIPDLVSTPRTRCGRRVVKHVRLNLYVCGLLLHYSYKCIAHLMDILKKRLFKI